MAEKKPRYVVVTGGNRGIGFEICRQLSCKGITVILTARDENRGLEAVETLKKEFGISDQSIVFHQLDINNAGVGGVITDVDALRAGTGKEGFKWEELYSHPKLKSKQEVKKLETLGRIRNQEEFEQESGRLGGLQHPNLSSFQGY